MPHVVLLVLLHPAPLAVVLPLPVCSSHLGLPVEAGRGALPRVRPAVLALRRVAA